jgi:uncharacterized phage-associated protein
MASADAVADYILGKIRMGEGGSITNFKLQMLACCCRASNLALCGEPLFDECVGPWAHGPAVWSLHRRFKDYGDSAIDTTDVRTDPPRDLSDRDRTAIDQVRGTCGSLSESQLRNLNCQEALWRA